MNRKLRSWLLVLSISVAYALLLRVVFGLHILRNFAVVMSLTFLLLVPFGVGYLTVTLSYIENVKKRSYRIFAPWAPVFLFLALTLLLKIEGWACWLMILPLFLLFATLGGLTAGYFKLRRHDRMQKLNISLLFLLPFVLAPLEKLLPDLPARYEAYTFIDIRSSGEKIWNNVIRVREISPENDHGSLTNWLEFPRPIRAELNYAGIGGSRQAIFSKGLVFEEVVTQYESEKKMHFSIKADPHAIPSTTMDEHIVIGGDYFDVLDGTYELEKLGDHLYRLHLYSHFTLKTHFNFYAGWWAGWIMKDIQNNILQVIQTRCQG